MRFWKRLCLFALLAAPLGAADKPFGVWWRGGADPTGLKQRCPWARGVFVAVKWSEFEPQQGK